MRFDTRRPLGDDELDESPMAMLFDDLARATIRTLLGRACRLQRESSDCFWVRLRLGDVALRLHPQGAGLLDLRLTRARETTLGKMRQGTRAVTVALLTMIALAAALTTGCVRSVPLQGPGDGTANVFVHPITGEVVHCETAGLPYQTRGVTLPRRVLTPHCAAVAEKEGFVQE